MISVEWYFDFLSPFAYLQSQRLDDLPDDVEITFRPILFVGLLRHWETKGPGQIPPKRLLTMRHIEWLARRMGVPYRLPSSFPFVPLRALRLAVSLGPDRAAVETIFRCIWQEDLLPDDDAGWRGIAEALGVGDADARVESPEVKQGLVDNGERAIGQGLFGVPTFVHDRVLFWGLDETDFLLDVLANPGLLKDAEMARIETVPSSVPRPAN